MITLRGTELFHDNGVKIGEVLAKEDGFYDFWPELHGGYWPAHLLRAIANLLDDKNRDWDRTINNDPRVGGEPPPELKHAQALAAVALIIARCRNATADLDIGLQLGDIDRARRAADEIAAALKDAVCGDRGFAGPSHCILMAGHEGPHRYAE